MDDFGDLAEPDRLHKNLVGLQEDGGHSRLEHGVVAEHERYSVGLCVAHGVDDGEAIGGIRHVEIREQNVEVFGREESQSFAYGDGGYHFKAVAFQALLIRGSDVLFVFGKQNSRFFHHRLGLPKGTRISGCCHSEQESGRMAVRMNTATGCDDWGSSMGAENTRLPLETIPVEAKVVDDRIGPLHFRGQTT
jgi:hypothetical protein